MNERRSKLTASQHNRLIDLNINGICAASGAAGAIFVVNLLYMSLKWREIPIKGLILNGEKQILLFTTSNVIWRKHFRLNILQCLKQDAFTPSLIKEKNQEWSLNTVVNNGEKFRSLL